MLFERADQEEMMSDMNEMLEPLFGGEPNLSTTQRGLYIVGGLGLAAAAATPRPNPLLNVLALAGGAYLALSGYYGRCPAKAALIDGNGGGRRSIPNHSGGGGRDALSTREMDYVS